MASIKCFLIEDTGRVKEIPCDCGQTDCPETNTEKIWRRQDTGAEGSIHDHEFAPAGAMFFFPPYEDNYKGFDGRCLVVRTPAGDWIVDSEASNCTRKGDKTHRCWLRDGVAPNITVSKTGAETCAAGAGSILFHAIGKLPAYHGFLRNGYLEDC